MHEQLDGSAVAQVAQLARDADGIAGKVAMLGDHQMSTVVLHHIPPKPEPEPPPLTFRTLEALVGYVDANRDDIDLEKCVVIVHGPTTVGLAGPLTGEARQRFFYARAHCDDLAKDFIGRAHSQTEFVIGMQSRFTPEHSRAEILALVQRLKEEQSLETEDDGVGQRATVKSGVHLAEQVDVPNPVLLAPYRTFREVEQPESRFVLRVERGPRVALYEADGGAWQLEAVTRVATWLRGRLEGTDLPVLS